MKRVALVFVLTLSILGLPSHAAVTAGGKCSKVGNVAKYKGSEFKCVKVNKKLVWQKITKSSQPTPTPSPTPSPSPTPTPSIPVFTPPTNRPKTIKDLDPTTAWYFAWESMDEIRRQSQAYTPKFNFLKAQNFTTEKLEVIKEGLNEGAKFWSSFWKYDDEILVFLGTELDLDFWEKELTVLYDSRFHKNRDEIFKNLFNDFQKNGAENNSAGASWFSNRPNMNFAYGTKVTAENIRSNSWQTSPHEFTHLVQGTLSYAFSLYGSGEAWMSEGQAEHTGIFLSKSSPEEYLKYRNIRFKNHWLSPDQRNLYTPEQIYAALSPKSGTAIYNAHYSFGAAAWEALVAVYGQDAILKYFNKIKSGTWWPVAFKEVFGMSDEEFLIDVSGYLSALRRTVMS